MSTDTTTVRVADLKHVLDLAASERYTDEDSQVFNRLTASLPSPKYNYIIVRVEEEDRPSPPNFLNAGRVRKAIHEVAKERGINVSDMIIRHDRQFLPHPLSQPPRTAKPNPYTEAEELFRKAMP